MNEQEIRRVSAEAMIDARTIRRYLAREPIKDASRFRIEQAMERLGIKPKEGKRGR